jgi:hypothetical protein
MSDEARVPQFNLNSVLIIAGLVTTLGGGFIWAGQLSSSVNDMRSDIISRDIQIVDLQRRLAILEGVQLEHERRLTAAGH